MECGFCNLEAEFDESSKCPSNVALSLLPAFYRIQQNSEFPTTRIIIIIFWSHKQTNKRDLLWNSDKILFAFYAAISLKILRSKMPVIEKMRSRETGMRARKARSREKRVPQRGLGVAQLEKLRMEEEHKECLLSGYMIGGGLTLVASGPKTCAETSSCLTNDCLVSPETLQGMHLPKRNGTADVSMTSLDHQQPVSFRLTALHAAELPMVNLASCAAIQMEPPSNQNYSSPFTSEEECKISNRKRLSLFPQEEAILSKVTRLDKGSSAACRNREFSSPGSFERKLPWQVGLTMTSGTNKNSSDVNTSYDSGYGHMQKACSVGSATMRDSCSSTGSMQPTFQLNWRGSNENDIMSQENEPWGDFLRLRLFASANGQSSDEMKEFSTISDGKHSVVSDGNAEHMPSPPFYRDSSTEVGSVVTYQFEGLLKDCSSTRRENKCNIPLDRFMCNEPNDTNILGPIYHANRITHPKLDLTLSL